MDINNFRVSPDGDGLEIWVEVPEGSNYEDITIQKIAIQDSNHYTIGYPDRPQIELLPESLIPDFQITDNKKVIKILKFKDLKILGICNTGMYFMYVQQTGIPSIDTPCICNKTTTIAVAANLYPIYNKGVKLVQQFFKDTCKDNIRQELLDLHWGQRLFLDAVEVEDYITAIEIFNNILGKDLKEGDCLNACGCKGTYTGVIPMKSGCVTCGG